MNRRRQRRQRAARRSKQKETIVEETNFSDPEGALPPDWKRPKHSMKTRSKGKQKAVKSDSSNGGTSNKIKDSESKTDSNAPPLRLMFPTDVEEEENETNNDRR